jgi:hypothetical protein
VRLIKTPSHFLSKLVALGHKIYRDLCPDLQKMTTQRTIQEILCQNDLSMKRDPEKDGINMLPFLCSTVSDKTLEN